MAVTMETAEQALKILYLGVLRDQLNTKVDAFYNKIKSSSKHVVGKEVRQMAPYGINGGVGAGTETGYLPKAGGNQYKQFVTDTKNLYGVIEISDKSIKASANNAGAFVNLLNQELQGLVRASKFNLSRMLHTDGSGILTVCKANDVATTTLEVESTKYLIEGLTIDIRNSNGVVVAGGAARRILSVDRANNKIIISGEAITTTADDIITVQNSYGLELTGMDEIFKTTGELYGVNRTLNHWMIPYIVGDVGSISDIKIRKPIDHLEEIMGSTVDYLLGTSGVVRSYYNYLETTKRNVNTLELEGGFKSIGFAGIPMVSSRFAKEGTLKLLSTGAFTMHHMGDWEWMEGGGGRILQQVAGTPVWTATLVRYAEMVCAHPGGQAELQGITEDEGMEG